MSEQATLWTIPSAIFSPGSAAGHSHSGSPDGQMTAPSGPDPAPASLSPSLGPEVARQTDDIFGRSSDGSLMSADLQASMESKLRVLLAGTGSLLYELTWKQWSMRSGRPICALRARARRISASDYIFVGWATPTVRDWKDTPGMSTQSINPDGSARSRLDLLPRQAFLAGWPTPMAGTPAQNGNNAAGNTDYSRAVVALAGWPTPAVDSFRSRSGARKQEMGLDQMARTIPEVDGGPARITADGQMLTGSAAEMTSGGQLNPAHSRWLQGFPPEWDACAVTATRSSRR